MAWYFNPEARSWRTEPLPDLVSPFHRSLVGYEPTPLVEVPDLAAELGTGRVLVKDESQRLGLPAFKILGASYAIARALSARLGSPDGALALGEIRSRLGEDPGISLVAASDGNHGRAVAHVARLLGLGATIYVPADISDAAKDGIDSEGATLIDLDLPYDDVVERAAEASGDRALLIQDTSFPRYEDVPGWIVDGYDTMLVEVDRQLGEAGVNRLDLVVVPAGVGSLAQAVVAHYRSGAKSPAVLVVEPGSAASVTTALQAGQVVPVSTGETIMAGLNCGTLSGIAWPVLRDGLDASVTVTDEEAFRALVDLSGLGVDSGPCGASTLAGVRATLAHPIRRTQLGLSGVSVVVLLSTEGRAANPKVPRS